MISPHRVKAFILRHIYEIWATFDRKFDIIFWPTIDLLIFGLLGLQIQKLSIQSGIAGSIIGGLILWTLVYSIQRDISVSVLEDAWSRNIFNLFSTPLKPSEIVIGLILLSISKALLTLSFVTMLAWGIFGFNLFSAGPTVIFYIFNIFIFGWAFGFMTSALIFRFGSRVQIFAWSLIAVIYPISGVYYPVDILPGPLVTAARFLPVSYIFEGLRSILLNGQAPAEKSFVVIGFLNLFYLVIGISLFVLGFRSAKNRGWFIHPT